jgi:GTP-binding protein EngB required for normal cell division
MIGMEPMSSGPCAAQVSGGLLALLIQMLANSWADYFLVKSILDFSWNRKKRGMEMKDDDVQNFDDKVQEDLKKKYPHFDEKLTILVVGKVSAGKSSLLNAIFSCDRNDPFFPVSGAAGKTTELEPRLLGDNVVIVDSPGLNDVQAENSKKTIEFMSKVDLGILVVTGAADSTQKRVYDELRVITKGNALVVLNKIDEWEENEDGGAEVFDQWKNVLGVDRIFPTMTKGYDPGYRKNLPMKIAGIVELQDAIYDCLDKIGKSIILARQLADKKRYATQIVTGALVSVAAEAWLPGSAAFITATQVAAIASLHYLYTGQVLEPKQALAVMPAFLAQAVGQNLFLLAQSFLPPSGVLDVAASVVAVAVTLAILSTVVYLLENGYKLVSGSQLSEAFAARKEGAKKIITMETLKEIKSGDFKAVVYKFLFGMS